MYRACELKDQTYKKTKTLHFSERGHIHQTALLQNRIRKDLDHVMNASCWCQDPPTWTEGAYIPPVFLMIT